MNLCKPFIERPVTTIIITIALLLFGWVSYQQLPINELPDVDFPTITVTASLPGADPETMASAVATPLEKQFSTIASLDSMSSTSSLGQTIITLQFSLDRNIDAAAQDVQAAISQALGRLPNNMPNPPVMRKVNPSDAPVLYIALTAPHLPITQVDEYAETILAQRLSMVDGVAQVLIYGPQQYAVRIHLNPNAMTSRGLGINQVINALTTLNTNQPAGVLQGEARNYTVVADGQLFNAAQFNQAIINEVNGAPVRVRDIGQAVDSVANDQVASWYNGQRAIVLAIQRQPGANTVAVVSGIRQLLPQLEQIMPGGAKLNILYDRSVFIKAAINDVKLTLLLAIALVVGVILLFLGNFSATLIAALALPVSVVATFAGMYLLGYSLDNLSLMALILAVGFVVDDAIVVLENIMRYLEQGLDRWQAALKGSEEISFTVLSMTLSLAAVFIPILLMGGMLGRLFHEFAVVVGMAVLISGFVSLTLTPMLCSRLLRVNTSSYPWLSWFEKGFAGAKDYYARTLAWALQHRRVILYAGLASVACMGLLFSVVSKGFIPSEDTGILFGTTQVPNGLTFAQFVQRQQQVVKIIRANPDVDGISSTVGQGQGGTTDGTSGRVVVRLKPFSERHHTADEILQSLRQQLQKIPGITVYLQNPPAINIGGKMSSSSYQYVLLGTDWTALQQAATLLQDKISAIKGVQDVNSDLQMTNPQISLHILRDQAAALGITPEAIETALYSAYGEDQISSIYTPTDEYEVIADIDPQYQRSMADLAAIYVQASNGSTLVPLTAVAQLTQDVGPLTISHYNQLPAVTLSFNLAPGVSLGNVTHQIEQLANRYLPSSVSGTFAGTAQTFQTSMQTLPLLLLFTVLVIYMILAILYEHFGHPLTILTALPLAGLGALLMLFLFHQELDIFSFVGIIMLVGLVKKNGIMMVDFAVMARREQQLSPYDAIYQACLIRFRPIMMTTMAAILATLPIALGYGAGGESRQSLGIAVVGGLLFSQLLTLYLTPAFYLWLEEFLVARRQRRMKHATSS